MKRTFLTLVMILFTASLLLAEVPKTMSYQGLLTDASGSPVADGNYKLKFTISNSPGNNPILWEETHLSVPVVKGIFNVILGGVSPLNISFDTQYYLGVSINDGATLQPLTALTSSPYSLNVSDEAAVKSLSGMKGNIDLVAGNNLSIVYDSSGTNNSITISSTGSGGLTLPFNGTVNGAIPGFVVSSTGTANAIVGRNTGTNRAATFEIDNPSNFGSTIFSTTNGTGRAGDFTIFNSGSSAFAVFGASNGTGSGGFFQMSGTGTGLTVSHIGGSGNIALFQNSGSNAARIDKTGKGFFNGGTQAGGADIAEAFEVEGSVYNYEPGDVLAISLNEDRTVNLSNGSYSKLVAGVYATKPGVLLSELDIDSDHSDYVPMGVVGVLPTKVTSENGSIKRGDLLVTSGTPGHAMKGTDASLMHGAVIGKALENFDGTTGVIRVLVNVK